ncbi:hypothetical protein H5410_057555 [Solanum commersonii]|uniref:DUF4283 domain-containing protein n=1 Tax=Solanum commersonii TaxID=4109 RepID=A0A9J5WQ25_SOLCO|nr:hypothetical protein H5410_057555 [Solanum commersonii]
MDPINMQEVQKLLPIQLGTQGCCLVGWLARQHILVRFDRYDDYVLAAVKTVQYLLYNGLQKQFRVFPWTIGFNPKEETSRYFVWISFPNLPLELFAKQSLLSIASAAGKPIAIDKATQDKLRPSTARVKVDLDLLENLPHRIRIQYVNQKTGKSVDQFLRNQEEASQVGSEIKKYQGDAREILDEKRAKNKFLMVDKSSGGARIFNKRDEPPKDMLASPPDKSGVHDQVVVARDLVCQNKENFGQLLGKAVAHESASGDQRNKVGATKTLKKKLNENQLSLTTNPTLVHIDDEGQNNPAIIVASAIDDGHQLNGIRGDVVLIGKSGHLLATNATVDLALNPVNVKVVADGLQHDARGVETIECLVDNANKKIESDVRTNSIALMSSKSTCEGVDLVHESNWAVVTKKKSPSIGIGSPISNIVQPVVDSQTMNLGAREIVPQEVMCFNTFDALTNNIMHEINSSQVNSTNELVISKEKQGATSTLRWIDIADQEEEQVTSPPMQKKLSPTTPAFVPSSAKLVPPRQSSSPSTNVAAILSDHLVSSNIEKMASLAPININKQLQIGGTLSPNKFANIDDEDISEEGEEGEEEEMLDHCFAIATRNANISPRQQRNNKMKHGRKHSWDGKVTEEFVPRQLPMRFRKQNHMTVSRTSTRFNKATK